MKESEKDLARRLEKFRKTLVKKEIKPNVLGRKTATPAEIRKVIRNEGN